MRSGQPGKGKSLGRRIKAWLKEHSGDELISQAEALALRRDMLVLLTFVRDKKVVGTQNTGNMPLKAIREVVAGFVIPPELEHTIGEKSYSVRSETEVWRLHYLHMLAEVGRLLKTGRARLWQLTPQGESFIKADPLFQVSFMLAIWWERVNWMVAFPYEGMGEALPPFFNVMTLAFLRFLPVRTPIPFEAFADKLIEKSGLTWKAAMSEMTPMIMRSSIAQMVIYILQDFDILKTEFQEEPLGKGTISRLVSFEITPFGRTLLDIVAQ